MSYKLNYLKQTETDIYGSWGFTILYVVLLILFVHNQEFHF